jgi:hypothetical protein
MDGIWIMLQFAVDVNTLVANLHFVAADRDDAFDEILAGISGNLKTTTSPRLGSLIGMTV